MVTSSLIHTGVRSTSCVDNTVLQHFLEASHSHEGIMILIGFLVILIFSKGGIADTLANGHDNTNVGD